MTEKKVMQESMKAAQGLRDELFGMNDAQAARFCGSTLSDEQFDRLQEVHARRERKIGTIGGDLCKMVRACR